MSWSSLFAFNDANGRIGSTYTATGVAITAFVGGQANIAPVQNLASFTSLPIGVYSVSISVPLSNTAGSATALENWNIGASIVSTTSSTFALGSKSICPIPVTIPAETATSITLVTDFILNNKSGASTIYINSNFVNGASNNNQLSWNATTATSATIVATKLA